MFADGVVGSSAVVHRVCTKNAPEPTLHARVAWGLRPQYGAGDDAVWTRDRPGTVKGPQLQLLRYRIQCDMACDRNLQQFPPKPNRGDSTA
jgi:hypothetical protein